MSVKTLDQLLRDCSRQAKTIMHKHESVPLTFVGYRADGEVGFRFDQQTMGACGMHQADDKDYLVYLCKGYIMLFGCIATVSFSEAWILKLEEDKPKAAVDEEFPDGISDHPDRRECIHYVAEDIDGNRLVGEQSIIRPAGFRPHLDDDLKIEDVRNEHYEGRMIGMFDNAAVNKALRKVIRAERHAQRA